MLWQIANAHISVNIQYKATKPVLSESCDYALNDGAIIYVSLAIGANLIFVVEMFHIPLITSSHGTSLERMPEKPS